MNKVMTEEMWKKMLEAIGDTEWEIQTIPVVKNKIGVWFTVQVIAGTICIAGGETREPKSKKTQSLIAKEEFFNMYPIYLRRKAGERVSREAQNTTMNQVYIYAILENFCK